MLFGEVNSYLLTFDRVKLELILCRPNSYFIDCFLHTAPTMPRDDLRHSGVICKFPHLSGCSRNIQVVYHGKENPWADLSALWDSGCNRNKSGVALIVQFNPLGSSSQKVSYPVDDCAWLDSKAI